MIHLIPWGERTYGRVIWKGTVADVPVTSFLVYAHIFGVDQTGIRLVMGVKNSSLLFA